MTDHQTPIPTQFREPVPFPVALPPDQAAAHPVAGDVDTDGTAPAPAPDAPERDGGAVAATPATPPLSEAAPRREPIAAGTYAVYDDDAGGIVLVISTSTGETHHKHIPAKIIKAGQMMMGGANPFSAMLGGLL